MKKSIAIGNARYVADSLWEAWEEDKKETRINAKSLYNLVSIKKQLESNATKSTETLNLLAEQHGGVLNPETGGYFVPEEYREELNRKVNDFLQEEIEIDYNPIRILASDQIPASIMDILFDFIVFEDPVVVG